MVHPVVLAGQNDVAVLQEGDPARQPKVSVRPLVDLVGEGDEDGQSEHIAVPWVLAIQLRCRETN